MQSIFRHKQIGRLSSLASIRHYTPSPIVLRPTALHRAEEAANLKRHPESGVTQEKRKDVKHDHHWTQANATLSEENVKADRDSIKEELGK